MICFDLSNMPLLQMVQNILSVTLMSAATPWEVGNILTFFKKNAAQGAIEEHMPVAPLHWKTIMKLARSTCCRT